MRWSLKLLCTAILPQGLLFYSGSEARPGTAFQLIGSAAAWIGSFLRL